MRSLRFDKIVFILITVLLPALYSCKDDTKFDSSRWNTKHDMSYPYRDLMADGLVKNRSLTGSTNKEIIRLLGEPDYDDTIDNRNFIFYEILTVFGTDMDPVYTKTLAVEFDRDMKVKNVQIEEWKKTEK